MQEKRHNKIFYRVFALFGVFVLAVVLSIGFMVIPLQKQSLQEIMYTQAITVSRSIVQACSDAMISDDFGFIVEHNLQVLKNNNSIHYVLISPTRGQKILVEPTRWKILENLDPLFTKLESQQEFFMFLENHLVVSNVYHFTYPINFSGAEWGWIHIGFSTKKYKHHIKEMSYQIVYIVGVSLVLISLFGYFFTQWIIHPLLILSDMATRVAAGNLDVKAELQRDDEIGNLFTRFNQMVKALKQSKENLENYNQHLEQEVNKRTSELDELNKNLDQRVKSEIMQRREQEQLLIHQSRLAAIGEMVGAIAHQWRQPLNALGLVIQNMQLNYWQGRLDDAAIKRSMDKSERLINKMSSTIDDFRNFFKPNKQVENFNLFSAIQSVIELIEASLKNSAIVIKLHCDKNLEVLGYSGELSQVILNLISNAKDALLEFRPENPEITIEATKLQGKIIIKITDNGGGIKQQYLHKIFDPYFSTKSEGEGTGIGLYMSKMIVEKNMKGKLYARNQKDGVTFIIELLEILDIKKIAGGKSVIINNRNT
jgi:signal transduction histidine kinase